MNGRSIRSFTLDYYRKQGAEIRPLEGEAYQIVPAAGAAMTVTFDGEADQPLTTTSPQWRAILEDLTSDVAVSYRYLVNGPVADPAKTLAALLPPGLNVTAARLLKVKTRQAVGFTHRVTFDSPALNARQEMMHHHVWCAESRERMHVLEPLLYQLPCLLLRPETLPGEQTVQMLLARSLTLVDRASDDRGAQIERELQELLTEAEKRTNQYFEQQMGNVLAREVQLTEKLDGTIKRLTEAKTPEQIARYRQDGENLAQQLEVLKSRREQDLLAVEAACEHKLKEEHEKHELTAVTDLVALCHATYDVVRYDVTVEAAGLTVQWEVSYWPVTRALVLPDCAVCHKAMVDPVLLSHGGAACSECVRGCPTCGTVHEAPSYTGGECVTCQEAVCGTCTTKCHRCGEASCEQHVVGCVTCEAPMCSHCSRFCGECGTAICHGHSHRDGVNGRLYCEAHQPEVTVLDVPFDVPEEVEGEPEAEAAEAVEAPVLRPGRVVSVISGKELDARRAETCYSCRGVCEVQEMLNCPTCGIPACLSCAEAGCPACDSLEPAEADDPRLAFVFETYPQLARGRKWTAAQVGPFVATMWKRLGRWGMVVYHVGGVEPVVLSEFSHGPIETLGMTMSAWLGGKS